MVRHTEGHQQYQYLTAGIRLFIHVSWKLCVFLTHFPIAYIALICGQMQLFPATRLFGIPNGGDSIGILQSVESLG